MLAIATLYVTATQCTYRNQGSQPRPCP